MDEWKNGWRMSGLIDTSMSGWKNISVDMRMSGWVKTCLVGYMGE